MAWVRNGVVMGYDNRQPGEPAGEENVTPGNPPPVIEPEADHASASASVTSITRSGTTATVTTGSAHGLSVGQIIKIKGATQGAYNGEKLILTVPSGTTLTYAVYGSPTTPATGTVTWQARKR